MCSSMYQICSWSCRCCKRYLIFFIFIQSNSWFFTVESNEENLCTYYDEDDCRFSYVYSFVNNKVEIRAQQELECPPKVFLLGIVLGVIAIIVLIGLAILLLWKLLTTIHDRREFAKFEKERMMAKWDTVSTLRNIFFHQQYIIIFNGCFKKTINCISGWKSNL